MDSHRDTAHYSPVIAQSTHTHRIEGTWLCCPQLDTRAFRGAFQMVGPLGSVIQPALVSSVPHVNGVLELLLPPTPAGKSHCEHLRQNCLLMMSHWYFKSALSAVFIPCYVLFLPLPPQPRTQLPGHHCMWHSHTYSTVRSMHPGISWKFISSPEWFQVSSAIRSRNSPRALEVDPATINKPV